MARGLTLDSLPVEILQHIQHFLPTHAAALLSLTSKSIWQILGVIAILKLQGDYREVTEVRKFLVLLERDIPDCFACHECLVFHSIDDLEYEPGSLVRKNSTRLCRDFDFQAEKTVFGNENVHYLDFHRIMQQSDLALRKTAVQQLSFKTDTSIIDFLLNSNRILMRGQHFIEGDFEDRYAAFEQKLWDVAICNHITQQGHFSGELAQLNNCGPGCLDPRPRCRVCRTAMSCPLCPTDFESRLLPTEEGKHVSVITRWLDLGSCESPNEPHYRSHMASGSFHWVHGTAKPLLDYDYGATKKVFESICQDQGLQLYEEVADRFATVLGKKSQDSQLIDDLSWFKLEDN